VDTRSWWWHHHHFQPTEITPLSPGRVRESQVLFLLVFFRLIQSLYSLSLFRLLLLLLLYFWRRYFLIDPVYGSHSRRFLLNFRDKTSIPTTLDVCFNYGNQHRWRWRVVRLDGGGTRSHTCWFYLISFFSLLFLAFTRFLGFFFLFVFFLFPGQVQLDVPLFGHLQRTRVNSCLRHSLRKIQLFKT
jgi:hypothetical protein